MFLSDIATGDGGYIQLEYRNHRGSACRPQDSKWGWSRQQPSRNDWTHWRAALQSISSTLGALDSCNHLGPWIKEPHQVQCWQYDDVGKRLFLRTTSWDYWKVYQQEPSHTQRTTFVWSSVCHNRSLLDLLHIPIVCPTLSHQCIEMLRSLLATPVTTPPQSIFEAIERLGPGGWPLRNCDWTHVREVAQGIWEGKAIGASNGSHMWERTSGRPQGR
jgi:hypothetical protein